MANAEKIAARLLEKYPDRQPALRYADPLQRLIDVILSAQCTDARVMAHLPHRLAFPPAKALQSRCGLKGSQRLRQCNNRQRLVTDSLMTSASVMKTAQKDGATDSPTLIDCPLTAGGLQWS